MEVHVGYCTIRLVAVFFCKKNKLKQTVKTTTPYLQLKKDIILFGKLTDDTLKLIRKLALFLKNKLKN